MPRTLIFALCSALIFSQSATAEIYTWTDAEGNTVYSDQPSPNARRIEVSAPNAMEPPRPSPSYNQPDESSSNSAAAQGRYRRLEITSPANDSAVRANDGNLILGIAIDPPLRTGALLRARVDGTLSAQALPGSGQTEASLTLPNLDRGSHQIEAVITNTSGEELSASSPITVHVQRTSLNQPGRINSPNQAPRAPAAPTAPNVPKPPASTP
ncbi:DUF4124 domain-containing protein [Halopseudomonas aestusnigri]|uniref:DUF4124 domain-containing protein n=1 Tax=Halopseudomonas aestusnigri TaxID=857252 RepID=A0AAQ1G811_9GAMM|nr:DUF4124 domain-containing protein [Halopseudomonas aestusnigri]SEG45984.1 protein of unknown function [Halopseudomonas aestusnigri]